MLTIKELRAPKIADIALFDLSATIIGALAIGYATSGQNPLIPHLILAIIIVMFIAIATHATFSIPTRLNQYLGLTTEKELQDARKRVATPQNSTIG